MIIIIHAAASIMPTYMKLQLAIYVYGYVTECMDSRVNVVFIVHVETYVYYSHCMKYSFACMLRWKGRGNPPVSNYTA